MFAEKKKKKVAQAHVMFFFREFQSIESALDDSFLLSDQNTNQFLV